MSNKDSNGFELPWILHTEQYGTGTRSRIVPNPSYDRLERDGITEDWALTLALKDAIVHLQAGTSEAIAAHIRDAHLWKSM